jgi:hypothetical protein
MQLSCLFVLPLLLFPFQNRESQLLYHSSGGVPLVLSSSVEKSAFRI